MSVARRDLFRIAGSGLAAASGMAQHRHPTPTTKLGDYEPRVLNAEQYSTLQRLLELLLPADEKVAERARCRGGPLHSIPC